MTEFDPIQYGRLLQSVETLSDKLDQSSAHIDALNSRMAELESRWKLGKATMTGIAIGIGFAVKGIYTSLIELFK